MYLSSVSSTFVLQSPWWTPPTTTTTTRDPNESTTTRDPNQPTTTLGPMDCNLAAYWPHEDCDKVGYCESRPICCYGLIYSFFCVCVCAKADIFFFSCLVLLVLRWPAAPGAVSRWHRVEQCRGVLRLARECRHFALQHARVCTPTQTA